MKNAEYKKKSIIFCLSYLSVPITISIIESSNEDFLIVTSNKTLVTFFKRFYPSKNIFLLKRTPLISKKPLKCILNLCFIYRYKKEIYNKFNVYQDAKVFFFAVAYCEFASWLVKMLSKTNDIFYKSAVSIQHLNPDQSIGARIGKWVRRFIYSIDFKVLISNKNTYYALSHEFLQGIKAKEFHIDVNIESICDKIINNIQEIKNVRVIILCGGIIGTYVERSEYIRQMDILINLLVKKFGCDALAIKTHPRFNGYFSKENLLKKIPADIAANLILSHFDTIIGYSTATLAEAANAGGKAISLLRLMEPIDINVRDSHIAYLDNNATKAIYYPDSCEELIEIIEKNE